MCKECQSQNSWLGHYNEIICSSPTTCIKFLWIACAVHSLFCVSCFLVIRRHASIGGGQKKIVTIQAGVKVATEVGGPLGQTEVISIAKIE